MTASIPVRILFAEDGAGGWVATSPDVAYTAGGDDLDELADRILSEFPAVFPGASLGVAFIGCTWNGNFAPGGMAWDVPEASL